MAVVERIVKKYYETLEDGKVLGRKCPSCGNVEWPPVYACNACGCLDTEWTEMSGKGEVLVCIMPTVMSSKPAYKDHEPYAYCIVKCEEGPERTVMVMNITRQNISYVREHLPYPCHMEIVQRDGYKTAVFAIDPINADGTPDLELAEKRKKAARANVQEAAASEAPAQAVQAAVDPEVFGKLAQIVADAYKVDVSQITPDTQFEGEFKASSVVFVGIVAMIENEFDVFMSIRDASKHKTVGELAQAIAQELGIEVPVQAAQAADVPKAAEETADKPQTEVDPEVYDKLAQIVADAYKVDISEITPDTPFEGKFKASSVVFVGIVAMIENEFDVFMSIRDASKHKTVGELAQAISEEL